MRKILGLVAGLLFGTTVIAQEQIDFEVVIPDSWQQVEYSSEENLWAYESDNGKHRLTVSILYYSKEPSHAQQRQFLDDFLRIRQEQSSKLGVDTKFTEITISEYEAAWVGNFNETSTSGRLAANKAISSRIGIANFYFESTSSRRVHEKIRSKILSTTGFAS